MGEGPRLFGGVAGGFAGWGEGLPEGPVGVGEAPGAEIGVLTEAALEIGLELWGEGQGGGWDGMGEGQQNPNPSPTA